MAYASLRDWLYKVENNGKTFLTKLYKGEFEILEHPKILREKTVWIYRFTIRENKWDNRKALAFTERKLNWNWNVSSVDIINNTSEDIEMKLKSLTNIYILKK